MAEICKRKAMRNAEIFLLLEEISNQCTFFMNMVVALRGEQRVNMTRDITKRIKYVMANRIPKQIEHLNNLVSLNELDCMENLRMTKGAFARLCYLLRTSGGLSDSKYVAVTEKVALFVSIIAHHKKMKVVKFDFKRSSHTVSIYVHEVLLAILRLHSILLVKPKPIDESDNSNNRWKWFKGCLGALDGTHIRVTVPEIDKPRYRTRKGEVAVNVLGVVDRNLNFVYVLCGWEGSAADCRVLRDAINRPNDLKIPRGNYHLCDNGYTNGKGFLSPYKGVRYHLKDWGEGRLTPQNPYEFFNMCHSKARNVVERSFGILKKRWSIHRSATFYDIKTQNRLIMACILLHKFIRMELPVDPMEMMVGEEDEIEEGDDVDVSFIDSVENSDEWSDWRDTLATSMFNEWRCIV